MNSKLNIPKVRAFGEQVDFGKTAADYGAFRAGFPTAFFDEIEQRKYICAGQMALDLGTGTGTVARGLAQKGLRVTGVDPATALLEEAKELDEAAGVIVNYRVGNAEELSETDASIDIITAGQCWHWFDRPAVAREAGRVLVPGGRIIVAHFDWLPLPGNAVEATEHLILKYNPGWAMAGGSGLYPDWLADLGTAGFREIETFSFDVAQPYSHQAWRGRIRASAGVKASLDNEAVARFDAELKRLLERNFPDDPMSIPHRTWAVTGVKV